MIGASDPISKQIQHVSNQHKLMHINYKEKLIGQIKTTKNLFLFLPHIK